MVQIMYWDTLISVRITLIGRDGRRRRGITMEMQARDYDGDMDRLREQLLARKEWHAELFNCEDDDPEVIEQVFIDDPQGILTWLSLDPATLLPNDLTYKLP